VKNEESGASPKANRPKNEEFGDAEVTGSSKNEEFGEQSRGKRHVVEMKPGLDDAIKPSELIQISGHQTLTLSARRAITILWHNAHRQGIEPGKDYVIELSNLRTDGHKGTDTIEESIMLLMRTILTVRMKGNVIRRVQFLGGNDMSDPSRPAGTLTYSFDKRLVEILQDSMIWGKIALPVLMAFSTKYGVSLYEHASQWTSLQYKIVQDLTIDELRDIMGVEEGKYAAFGDLNLHVIKPAVQEINALAPFNITVQPIKTARRVTGVKVGWSPKSNEELSSAWQELQRSKIGRKARISGRVASVFEPARSVTSEGRRARLEMRRDLIDDDPSEL
jgi:hypothetical protein